jgi:CSLREA domain-containing protein
MLGAAIGLLLPSLGAATPVQAATFVVNTTSDHPPDGCTSGDCTLREAVIAANESSGFDIILVRAGTYALTIEGRFEDGAYTGDLDLTDDVAIVGAGFGITVDAQGIDRVFDVHEESDSRISFMTITGGVGFASAQDPEEVEGSGGGILVRENAGLHLRAVVVTNNEALDATGDGHGDGGGLSSFGTTVVVSSFFRSNEAASEGGGVESEGTLEISHSGIMNNYAGVDAGGALVEGNGALWLTNVTISGNRTVSHGGGIQAEDSGYLYARSTYILNNHAENGGGVHLTNLASAEFNFAIIMGNQADVVGGGLFMEGPSTASGFAIVTGNTPDNCVPASVVAGCQP